jgi:hypothetical protein
MQDKRLAGKYNRRLEISEPVSVSGRFNEKKTEMQVKYPSYPACKIERTLTDDQSVQGNVERAVLDVEWDLRFIPNFFLGAGWQVRDIFDGRKYNVVAPSSEINRAEGILIRTKLVE